MAIIEDAETVVNVKLCDDIIEQILSRVPIKSMLRFKTVCRSWRNLITHPKFAINELHNAGRIYMSASSYSYRLVNGQLQVKSRDHRAGSHWFLHVPATPGSSCSDIQVLEFGNTFSKPFYSIEVNGSCNGLLYVTVRGKSFLWNPLTREHAQLSYTYAAYDLEGTRRIAGLGYNSMSDEYKAVLLSLRCTCHAPGAGSHLFVYSSRARYWKVVDQEVSYCLSGTFVPGVTVNGCPHWITYDCREFGRMIIMFFDTLDDKLKILPTPKGWYEFEPTLSVLGRSLCATGENLANNTIDVWVMNEYGVGDSWIKTFVVPDSVISGFSAVPVGILNRGDEVVFEVASGEIMTYNSKTRVRKFVMRTTTQIFKSFEYVTSLVSPFPFINKRKKQI